MLMSRYGVSDGRSHARELWGECPVSRWVLVSHRLRGNVPSSPRANPKAAFSKRTVCADMCREVAS